LAGGSLVNTSRAACSTCNIIESWYIYIYIIIWRTCNI
jgi:hypothetical protein